MSHSDFDVVLTFEMGDLVRPTPFGGKFLIFLKGAVFVKEH
jgi:hypothetical protein